MLAASHFNLGTILWLPKQKDIPDFDELHPHNTVPDRCFGHPILIIGLNKSTGCATVLILTSFGESVKIFEKIKYRHHQPDGYVPIEPAHRLYPGTPTLQLCSSQRLARDNWAYLKEPHRCPKAWLEETWADNWIFPASSRVVAHSSLHSLAVYATSKGFDPRVYKLLKRQTEPTPVAYPKSSPVRVNDPTNSHRTAPTPTPYSQAGPVHVNIQPSTYNTVPATDSRCAVCPSVPSYLPIPEPNIRQWWTPSESTSLLPQANHRPRPVADPYRRVRSEEPGSEGERPSRVGLVCSLLLFLGLIGGFTWGGYIVVTWIIAVCRDTIGPNVNAVAGKVATSAINVWTGLCGLGPALSALWERLTVFIRGLF
ncbi:hypothetical protein BCR34DRAFT_595865 [Clohesyomyces aquaticus]|uniref:Uncharacterized protein n=1 Tax=Clohesyomyces aquaticus TaxID=1231657 RepID=A0A1Y2A941_9PLEO|nr:hypothetical protein BCR34DRAFT_595865 [Clohesyomyces aquaticus]